MLSVNCSSEWREQHLLIIPTQTHLVPSLYFSFWRISLSEGCSGLAGDSFLWQSVPGKNGFWGFMSNPALSWTFLILTDSPSCLCISESRAWLGDVLFWLFCHSSTEMNWEQEFSATSQPGGKRSPESLSAMAFNCWAVLGFSCFTAGVKDLWYEHPRIYWSHKGSGVCWQHSSESQEKSKVIFCRVVWDLPADPPPRPLVHLLKSLTSFHLPSRTVSVFLAPRSSYWPRLCQYTSRISSAWRYFQC